jgi:hypothetical protein
MMLVPAYGRDYASKKEVVLGFNKGEDFVIADVSSPDNGNYCNKEDLLQAGVKRVIIRYKRLKNVIVVEVKP